MKRWIHSATDTYKQSNKKVNASKDIDSGRDAAKKFKLLYPKAYKVLGS